MVQESKERFSKLFKHLVLNEKETESNWGTIALAAIEAYSKPFKYTHIHWCLQYNSLKQNQFLT